MVTACSHGRFQLTGPQPTTQVPLAQSLFLLLVCLVLGMNPSPSFYFVMEFGFEFIIFPPQSPKKRGLEINVNHGAQSVLLPDDNSQATPVEPTGPQDWEFG